ncbi:hypothetical protein ACIBCO_04200 [Streptomyces violascens]|uniref:hypothetical protein n=1 Tax=Streptomyces violascens TaxID=67381 RepID=UPI0037917F68
MAGAAHEAFAHQRTAAWPLEESAPGGAVARDQVPRTTSGKTRRRDCAKDVRAGRLPLLAQGSGTPIHEEGRHSA